MKWKSLSHVQLFVTPWTTPVHGILKARILEQIAFPFSREYWTCQVSNANVMRTHVMQLLDYLKIPGLGWSLGEGNGTPLQYSCLENPMDRGAWKATVYEVAESDTTERLHFHFSLSCIGVGNGTPLQCSCLENPRDGGAWWAAISGVAQSWTWLKWLSRISIA